jgi:hypothetical protein
MVDNEEQVTERVILISCPLTYSLIDEDGNLISHGQGEGQIGKENLLIIDELGDIINLSLHDLTSLSVKDYKIRLTLTSQDEVLLSNLGYQYEDFAEKLISARNQLILKDLLMEEKLHKGEIAGEFIHTGVLGDNISSGECELRLYDTGLVIMAKTGEITRIPYGLIEKAEAENYRLSLTLDSGEKYILFRMGTEFQPFVESFEKLNSQISQKTQNLLRQLLPEANSLLIRKISILLKDGKCAKKSDLNAVSPGLWNKLEAQLSVLGIEKEYEFLKALGQQKRICLGIKQGLWGDLTGQYIWFLIPIYSLDPSKPGNAIALEAAADEKSGKATYFFRITGRQNYRLCRNLEDLHREADRLIQKINYCMLMLNFRREPIYLPEESLAKPNYSKYRFAITTLPYLQSLRQLFIGRVFHSSSEQWEKDVEQLLKFNVTAETDQERWSKNKKLD